MTGRTHKKIKPWKIESAWCVEEDGRTLGTFMAYGQRAALRAYADRDLAGQRAFVDSRFEWSSANGRWREDDGEDRSGREWRLIATFDFGGYERDRTITAWKA